MKLTPKELTQARHSAATRKANRNAERSLELREALNFGAEQRRDDDRDYSTGDGFGSFVTIGQDGWKLGGGTRALRFTMDNQ